jgi:hypothetical protein
VNQAKFKALCEEIQAATTGLLVQKGEEYAGSTDRLANFKRGAAATGVDPLTVLYIYMSKHWDSVSTYVRKSQQRQEQNLSEPIEGRLHDLINYATLAIAILREQQEDAQWQKK